MIAGKVRQQSTIVQISTIAWKVDDRTVLQQLQQQQQHVSCIVVIKHLYLLELVFLSSVGRLLARNKHGVPYVLSTPSQCVVGDIPFILPKFEQLAFEIWIKIKISYSSVSIK